MNTPEARTAAFPAFGGIGTASALARFYSMLAGGGAGRMPEAALLAMQAPLATGFDGCCGSRRRFPRGLCRTRWPATEKSKGRSSGLRRAPSASPGAGGSFAFADPESGLGFAYVMNQMEPGVLPNRKSRRMIEAMYGCLGADGAIWPARPPAWPGP